MLIHDDLQISYASVTGRCLDKLQSCQRVIRWTKTLFLIHCTRAILLQGALFKLSQTLQRSDFLFKVFFGLFARADAKLMDHWIKSEWNVINFWYYIFVWWTQFKESWTGSTWPNQMVGLGKGNLPDVSQNMQKKNHGCKWNNIVFQKGKMKVSQRLFHPVINK